MKLCKTCGGGRGLTTWEASLMSLGHSKYYASYTQSSRTLDMGFWKQFDHFHATPMVWNPFIIKAKRSRQKEVYFKCIWVKDVALYIQCHKFSKLFITLGILSHLLIRMMYVN
jgi:hypothetical protein